MSLAANFRAQLSKLPPLTAKTALLSTALLVTPPIFLRFRANYHAYLANGRGGLPYNVFGWALQWVLRLVARFDRASTKPYDDPKRLREYGDLGQRSFLRGRLDPRKGGRAEVLPWIAPHRQREGNAPDIRKLQKQMFDQIAASNPSVVQIRTSAAEKHEDALWLSPDVPMQPWAKRTVGGECAHVHLTVDGSAHVTLSIADAKEVVGKNWGERHGLSGVFIPWGYVLLYAPRDESEVEVMENVFKAGIGFMAGGERDIY